MNSEGKNHVHFIDTNIERGALDFKEVIIQFLELFDIRKKDLAGEFSVSEQSASRWMHPNDECNLPAFLIKRLVDSEDAKLQKLGLSLAKYMCDDAGFSIIRNVKTDELNGNLTDEICEIAKEAGLLSEHREIPKRKVKELMEHADRLIYLGFVIKAECNKKNNDNK